ncbi:VanZ domain-containing protein [Trichophyton interdigitale]|uniref:VanZ-like domain-containing protein n=1 Tax=Trichophyton interdigitale (strain MR816) TaxID=1215338 RepID=A0A059J4I4_TRIIM|nr:hypothetical protein H101_03144 [Trichophyton interdigitale H6]KAG5208011.1 VanZ domain-containing protein [Trichophyton interdigitale]KAG5217950.1 VanZ domain-containing protein [Trichophyton interdigitale]KAG8206429.1 VanZ domain-containing protein [Trichophyton interdigitale]KDB22598.1 hypothetical protein H109_05468 [Trichophyton interdigitale MR816]
MAMLRIRYPFAGAFAAIFLLSAYVGLLPHSNTPKEGQAPVPSPLQINDKALHLITFFLLSLAFYWIIDTTRRRTLHLTLIVCTLVLGIGSEIVQSLIPNGRSFDPLDILANVVGSLGSIGLCTWYHKRMLERRRKARFGALVGNTEEDVELGLANGTSEQETGVTNAQSLEEEVDNWDENAEDNWDAADDVEDSGVVAGSSDDSTGDLGGKASTNGAGKPAESDHKN